MVSAGPKDKKVCELIAAEKKPWFSFEYFPPKTDVGVENLKARIVRMQELGPLFMDFTWGAGGSTSELTMQLCDVAKNQLGCVTNMHLTCTNMPPELVDKALADCKKSGVCNLVALRGDPPHGSEKWQAVEGGFECAEDLCKYILKHHGDWFSIAVAGYPEGHPDNIETIEGDVETAVASLTESEKKRYSISTDETGKRVVMVCRDASYKVEMEYLKKKIDAGANLIITQMFLDATVFIQFMQDCKEWGINVPVVPGIMCLNGPGGLKRMVPLCKTRAQNMLDAAERANTSDEAFKKWAIEFGTDLCQKCLDAGACGLHFYTLNVEKVTLGMLKGLKLITEEQHDKCLQSQADSKRWMLDGRHVSGLLLEQLKSRIKDERLRPHLHVISVGEDPASQVFIQQKKQRALDAGIGFSHTPLRDDSTLEELQREIRTCNANSTIHGIIVQLPLPAALQAYESEVLKSVDAAKDVDCFHPLNYGQLSLDRPVFLPATPAGILKLIDHYQIPTKGKLCVILGKSNIVGKPLGLLLANEQGPAATVVLCDRYTEKAKELTQQADILIVAAGKHHLVNSSDWLREDKQAVVIDVGIHRIKTSAGKTVVQGDVDADAVRSHCRFLTPVPGGVGPMTVACLLEQVVKAAAQQLQDEIRVKNVVSNHRSGEKRLSKEEFQRLLFDLNLSSYLSVRSESVVADIFDALSGDDGCVSFQKFVDWALGSEVTS